MRSAPRLPASGSLARVQLQPALRLTSALPVGGNSTSVPSASKPSGGSAITPLTSMACSQIQRQLAPRSALSRRPYVARVTSREGSDALNTTSFAPGMRPLAAAPAEHIKHATSTTIQRTEHV